MYETSFEDREFVTPEVFEGEWEVPAQSEVAQLATELLEIGSEAELDQFLGKLARSVVKGASGFIKSPIGKALGGVLKTVAKTALPAVGGALGSMVMPGIGTAIGSKLGSMAGGLLEVGEAESMGEAEAEFEAAQRYVRFARSAYAHAARAPRGLPPRAVVRASSVAAARRHAPGLLQDRRTGRTGRGSRDARDGRDGRGGRGATQRWRGRRRGGWDRYRPVYPALPWPFVAGSDGYAWPGYAGTGYPPDGAEPDPAPWATGAGDPGDPGDPDRADGHEQGQEYEARGAARGPVAQTGRWVRRGQRIVVLGV